MSSDEYKDLARQLEQARHDIAVLQDAKLNLENQFAQQASAEENYQKRIQ